MNSNRIEKARRALSLTILAGAVGIISACATQAQKRDVTADISIGTVAVVPMLSEFAYLRKIGFTRFNNDEGRLTTLGALNQFSMETVEARLRQARPEWKIVPSNAESESLAAKAARPAFVGGVIGNVKGELTAIAQRTGADALVVIAERELGDPLGRGVGAVVREFPGLAPRLRPHANIAVFLLDKNGEVLASGGRGDPMNAAVLASDFGWTGNLESISAGPNGDRLAATLREKLVSNLDFAVGVMGY